MPAFRPPWFPCIAAPLATAPLVTATGSTVPWPCLALRHERADAPERTAWDAATQGCARAATHGRDDCRLPTAGERTVPYRHRHAIGGFADPADDESDPLAYLRILQDSDQDHGYWSSNRDGRAASGLDFDSGNAFRLDVADTPVLFSKSVRCMRDGH
ncbi:hypothetical protein [Pseudoxanthomonas broegbernensis]|uniref:hypothetical protein n=1 Tax=Pseudoxanthomonas broegbernensis TaxID=83619 RepID=UPI001390B8C3|nr:hypothetical protein [Pseudoxanthomonas broegbernensis]MBB6063998.1 hypothetical protein [Pseudoxanthomonas broegbernensis]